MTFKPSQSLAEQVATFISDKIIRFELKQGERIIEEQLAGEMSVSRSPIREALRILESCWLVELIPRKEARVSVITEDMIVFIGDILVELYGMATRRAVNSGTFREFLEIGKALETCKRFSDKNDRTGYFFSIIELESACLEAAKNPVLNRLLGNLWPYSRRVQFATMQLRTESLSEHLKYFQQAHQHLIEGNGGLAASSIQNIAGEEIRLGLKYLPEFSKL